MNWLMSSATNWLPCWSARETALDTVAWILFPKTCSKVLKKTLDSWSMRTLSSCVQRTAQSHAITETWEVISAEQLMSVRLSIGKAAKVSCRQRINPHTLSQSPPKKQESLWEQRILKVCMLPLYSSYSSLEDLEVTRAVGGLCRWSIKIHEEQAVPARSQAQPQHRQGPRSPRHSPTANKQS